MYYTPSPCTINVFLNMHTLIDYHYIGLSYITIIYTHFIPFGHNGLALLNEVVVSEHEVIHKGGGASTSS